MDTKYNGWTNYATWRVNLEVFDQLTIGDFWGYEEESPENVDAYELSHVLKDYTAEIIEETSNEGLARDYAIAFISDVNWYEIAEHLINESEV